MPNLIQCINSADVNTCAAVSRLAFASVPGAILICCCLATYLQVCPTERNARGHASGLLLQAAMSRLATAERVALLEAAVTALVGALPSCGGETAESFCECGDGHALLALELAAAARSSTLRERSHTREEPSTSGSMASAHGSVLSHPETEGQVDVDQQLVGATVWQSVRRHAHESLRLWRKALSSTTSRRSELATSSVWLAHELAALAGVQGQWLLQQQAWHTAAELADAFGEAPTPPEPCRCPLACTFIAAAAEDAGCIGSDSWSRQASFLREEADRLAQEGGGHPAVSLRRALLHQRAASLAMRSGRPLLRVSLSTGSALEEPSKSQMLVTASGRAREANCRQQCAFPGTLYFHPAAASTDCCPREPGGGCV